jgi:hypothetical protein
LKLPFVSRRQHDFVVNALRERIAHLEGDRPADGRPVYRTFGIARLDNTGDHPRVFYVFADGMIPSDLVTRIQRDGDEIVVCYNAGGQEFRATFEPLPAAD